MNKRNSKNQKEGAECLSEKVQSPYEDAPYKKYLPPVFILLTTILICLAWGTVWWYWLEYDWFPQAKDFVPGVIIPIILAVLHLIICFRRIRSLSDKIEKIVWIGLFAFSTFIFSSTTGFVKKQKASYVIADITVNNLHLFGEKDYIKINDFEDLLLLSSSTGYSTTSYTTSKRSGSDLTLVYTQVASFFLNRPEVFIGYQDKSTNSVTFASERAIEEWRQKLLDDNKYRDVTLEKGKVLKRLKQSDDIEPFKKAIHNFFKPSHKYYIVSADTSDKIVGYEVPNRIPVSLGNSLGYINPDNAIIYEITDQEDLDIGGSNIKIAGYLLTFEAIILFILFHFFYVRVEHEEATELSRLTTKSLLSLTLTDLKHIFSIDSLLEFAPLLLMIIMSVVLLLSGYSDTSSNYELLIKFGALDNRLVLENHEWWRLITFAFLHGGFPHFINNFLCYIVSLIYLRGEGYKGRAIFTIFMLSSITSGVFILMYSTGYTVGASGGVFGMLTFWGIQSYVNNKKKECRLPILIIITSLLFSFGYGVSMSGHIGGIVAGIILLAFFTKTNLWKIENKKNKKQMP